LDLLITFKTDNSIGMNDNQSGKIKMDLYNNIENWAIKHASGYENIPGLAEQTVMNRYYFYFEIKL